MTISNGFARAKEDFLIERQFKSTNPDGGRRSFGHGVALALAFLGLAVLAGCGGGSSITIQIEPSAISIDEGQSYNFAANVANDITNAGVTWSLTSGCSGSGCGTLSAATPFSVTFTAPAGLSASQSVTLTAISNANPRVTITATITVDLPPMFTNTSATQLVCVAACQLPSGGNGQPYNQTITSADGVAPLILSLASGSSLPAGLTLNQSGTIVGIPSAPTVGKAPITSTFTVKLSDSSIQPDSVTQLFSITVQPPTQLSITTTGPLPAGFINGKYSTSISATGGVTPRTWSVLPPTGTQTGLPPGLVLSTTSGQITGVPTVQASVMYPKTYTFTVQVQDSSLPSPGQAATIPLSITVQEPPALTIATNSLSLGTTATPYSASLQASGGIPPYTWAVTAGQLPAGLTLAPNGTISGTPILVTQSPVEFTVQLTDSEVVPPSPAPTQQLSLTITKGTTSSNTLLSGEYAFLFQGFDVNGPVSIAGTFVADGNGNITSGGEDSNRTSGVVLAATLSTVTPSTYSIGSDGRGTMELIFVNPQSGVPLRTDYNLVLYSNGNARFIENNTLNTTASNGDHLGTHGEGTLKYVTGTVTSTGAASTFASGNFSGNYAFEFTGQDLNGKPAILAGVVTANGAQEQLTPAAGGLNSDFNDNGAFSSQSITGTFSVESNYNRGVVTMVLQLPGKSQMTLTFECYFVSPTDLYFVEIDSPVTTSATVYYLLSGEMIAQQAGYQFQNSSLIGSSVATGTGVNGSNTSVLLGSLTSSTIGSGSLSYDENNGGTLATPSFTGSYSIGSNGRAAFTWTGTTTPRVAVAYLTGPGQGFLLGYDTAATGGMLEEQTGGPFSLTSFQGSYAIGTETPEDTKVPNFVGQFNALYTPTPAPGVVNLTASQTFDEIDPSGAHIAEPISAIVTSIASNGSGTMAANPTTIFPINLVFYMVSPSSVRAIPADSNPGSVHPEVILLDH